MANSIKHPTTPPARIQMYWALSPLNSIALPTFLFTRKMLTAIILPLGDTEKLLDHRSHNDQENARSNPRYSNFPRIRIAVRPLPVPLNCSDKPNHPRNPIL